MTDQKYTIDQLLDLLEAYLEKDAFSGFPDVLYESTSHIMEMKGKRIRPLMLLTSCQAFDGDVQESLGPACAVEVYHNFSLVHDDIIDEADIRRGQKTVHIKYGMNKAILTGDAMLLHSFVLLKRGPADKLTEMLKVFSKATSEVIEGEQYDVNFESIPEVTEEEYLQMIEFKTSVLLAASFELGALIGNASTEDQKNMYDFGLNLGLAFQIKDDYLDTYGDEKTFGKKIGGDILMNKKTYLLVTALTKADPATKEAIFQTFDIADENEKIAAITKMYDELGVKDDTFLKMEEFYKKSIASLEKVSIDDQAKSQLYQLAEMVYHRKH